MKKWPIVREKGSVGLWVWRRWGVPGRNALLLAVQGDALDPGRCGWGGGGHEKKY